MTAIRSAEAGPHAGPAPGPPAVGDAPSPSPPDGAPAAGEPASHPLTPLAPAGRARRRGGVPLAAAVAGALLAGGLASLLDPGAGTGAPTVRITARYSRFEPDRVTVKPGSTVRFVIHNADPIDHEFIIGPPETHDIHERGDPHFHTGAVPGEITVPAGATVETSWTFAPSSNEDVAYGCHLAGHWTYGMHGKALVR